MRVKTSDKLLTPCQYTYTAYQPEVARISQHELFLDMPVSGWLSGGMALLVGIVGVVQLSQRGLTCRTSRRRPVIVPETPCK